jgi:hypothetical protein
LQKKDKRARQPEPQHSKKFRILRCDSSFEQPTTIYYSFLLLSRITVEQKGFQTQVRNEAHVNVAATVNFDFTLQAGQVSEGVRISGEISTIQATQTLWR